MFRRPGDNPMIVTKYLSESDVRDQIDVEKLGLSLVRREYTTHLGRIDILAKDSDDKYVPIEVKLGEAADSSVGQILGYMEAVKADRGIIITAGFSKRVKSINKMLNIDLVPYVLVDTHTSDKNDVVICKSLAQYNNFEDSVNQNVGHAIRELDFNEAVINGYDDIRSGLVAVTIHLPMWIRTEVSNINLATNISHGRLYTSMINHGCLLMKHRIDERAKRLHDAYKTLGTSDNMVIMELMQEMTIRVGGDRSGGRKTLSAPMHCKNFLVDIANRLRMDFSSVVRLSLYTAIDRYDGMEPHNRRTCQTELDKFKKSVSDHMFVCNSLAKAIKLKTSED